MDEQPNPEHPTIAEFLEAYPPNRLQVVAATAWRDDHAWVCDVPQLQLHCPADSCNGPRFFDCQVSRVRVGYDSLRFSFLHYSCRNCGGSPKVFAVALERKANETVAVAKLGEVPAFGPSTPSRVIKLLGPDRELFLAGRRAENLGLGLGAFVYYRRVVEDQRSRILREVLRVSERIGAPDAVLESLRAAADEQQFAKSIDLAKDAIPPALLINGHNPLWLLHSALSEGVHAKTDEECLELARSIRVVLAELADRLGQALKDESELADAVARLLRTNSRDAKA